MEPQMEVPELAPVATVEILSPNDSYLQLMHKFSEYAAIGVPHIWLVDPITRRFSIYHDGSLTATATLELPEHGVLIRQKDVFDR